MSIASAERELTTLAARLQLEKEMVEGIQGHGECWPDSLGEYRYPQHSLINQLRLTTPLYEKISQEFEAPNFHNRLHSFVHRLLQDRPINQPVLLLDIGGGAGLTWMSVASDFREEIRASKIAFIVSNLAWALGPSPDPEIVNPEPELVHYVNSVFRKLCTQSVTLPDGHILPLRRNVDLVHECQSLTRWSQVPELDILSVYRLLSRKGTYFIASPGAPCKYTRAASPEDNHRQRQAAVTTAHRLLQSKFGLKQVTQVEDGEYAGAHLLYTVFKQPEAPLVTI